MLLYRNAACQWTCVDTVVAAAIAILLVSILVAVVVASVGAGASKIGTDLVGESVAPKQNVGNNAPAYQSLRLAPVPQYQTVSSPLDSSRSSAVAVHSVQ